MKALKIIGIIVGILVLLVSGVLFYLYRQSRPEKLVQFIHDNPDRSSIYFVQNDTVFASMNPDKVMPLASTVKTIIAIEYARQAALGRINPDEQVDTAALDRYYVPHTDGDAHPEWLKDMHKRKLVEGGKVRLEEVAKGMIRYSSNANTEYLLDRLGLDSVNACIERLGLKQQQPLYPFVSSLFIGIGSTPQKLKEMPIEKYRDTSRAIHERLKTDTAFKRTFKDISLDLQRVWSDRLPGGTTREYAGIMKKINSRTWFNAEEQKYLDIVMEGVMENPKNRTWLAHAGFKGGSTAFVFTMALYATTVKGEKTELAYFFNGLSVWEGLLLQSAANDFHLKLLGKKKTRNEMISIINGK